MNILALGFGLNPADKDRLKALFTATGLDKWTVEIYDAQVNAVPFEKVEVILLFGPRASAMCRDDLAKTDSLVVELPAVKQLHTVELGGDREVRLSVYNQLKQLTADLESGHVKVASDRKVLDGLTVATMPNLSLSTIQSLEKALKEAGRSTWMFRTTDGKIVGLSINGKKIEGADISISFAEMMAIRAAMDVFGVKDVKFVPQ